MLDRRKTYKVVIHDNRRNGLSDMTEYAIKAEIVTDEGHTQLGYWNFERGHLLDGKVKKELRNGIVFEDGPELDAYPDRADDGRVRGGNPATAFAGSQRDAERPRRCVHVVQATGGHQLTREGRSP